MSVVYNEIDGFAARWLANLIDAGQIAPGRVDARSIADLTPEDVADAIQFHTFAGIGGWSYALRLAGWPDDAPVWTGSCPCQPFSTAGRGAGFGDKRHMWPSWFELIRECRPAIVFGEQVASRAGLAWLDVVRADLEGEGYAVGAADLAAASVAAPHIRQRLYFVAVADARGASPQRPGLADRGRMGDADSHGAGRDAGTVPCPKEGGRDVAGAHRSERPSARTGAWSDAEWIACRDGSARPAQPGSFPLAYGLPARVGVGGAVETRSRVGELRGYGNAIVPQVAAEWIGAVMDVIGMARAALGVP